MNLDFEKEGFVFNHKNNTGQTVVYTKPYKNHPRGFSNWYLYIVYIKNSDWVVISEGYGETTCYDWVVMFRGRIKIQEDLQKVLELVII